MFAKLLSAKCGVAWKFEVSGGYRYKIFSSSCRFFHPGTPPGFQREDQEESWESLSGGATCGGGISIHFQNSTQAHIARYPIKQMHWYTGRRATTAVRLGHLWKLLHLWEGNWKITKALPLRERQEYWLGPPLHLEEAQEHLWRSRLKN